MRHGADEMKKRIILSDVALGNITQDTVIVNGTLFSDQTNWWCSAIGIQNYLAPFLLKPIKIFSG